MYVKLNFGPHTGQVRDIAPESAMAFLADGRASRAFTDSEPVAPPTVPAPAAAAAPAKKAARKRGN